MKAFRLIVVVSILSTVVIPSTAQNFVFRVMTSTAGNEFRKSAQAEWKGLRMGTHLNKNDEVKLVKNSFLGLYHSSGRTWEFRESGTYKVSELEKKAGLMKKGLPARYSDFVMNMVDDQEVEEETVRVRGPGIEIKVRMQKLSEIYEDLIVISWINQTDREGQTEYSIHIRNMYNDDIAEVKSKEEKVILDLGSTPELKETTAFVITITESGNEGINSGEYLVKRVPEEGRTFIEKELESVKPSIDESTSTGQIVLAGFFESHGLYLNAAYHFEKAIELSPGVTDIDKLYEIFMKRNKLIRQ